MPVCCKPASHFGYEYKRRSPESEGRRSNIISCITSNLDFTVDSTLLFPFADGGSFERDAVLGNSQLHGKRLAAVEHSEGLPVGRRFRQCELAALPVERHRQLHAVSALGHNEPRNVLSVFSRIVRRRFRRAFCNGTFRHIHRADRMGMKRRRNAAPVA